MRDGRLTVVLPVRDEGANLRAWWTQASSLLPQGARVLLVYDDETDDTLPVARALVAEGAPIAVIRNAGAGFAAALLTGLRAVDSGPVLVTMADLADDLAALPAMLAAWSAGADLVVGSRYVRGGSSVGGSRLKRLVGRWGSAVLRHAAQFPVRDASNAFRLYDGSLVHRLQVPPATGFEVMLALLLAAWQAGARVEEVPAAWRARERGASHFRLGWLPRYGALWLAALRYGLARPRERPAPSR